jgi:hypothetical protein
MQKAIILQSFNPEQVDDLLHMKKSRSYKEAMAIKKGLRKIWGGKK